jgi:glutamyl-tRNA reductase
VLHADISEIYKYVPIVDVIFIALSDCENIFDYKKIKNQNKKCIIIDLSFPCTMLVDKTVSKYMTIESTNWQSLNNCVTGDFSSASNEIDKFVETLICKMN